MFMQLYKELGFVCRLLNFKCQSIFLVIQAAADFFVFNVYLLNIYKYYTDQTVSFY